MQPTKSQPTKRRSFLKNWKTWAAAGAAGVGFLGAVAVEKYSPNIVPPKKMGQKVNQKAARTNEPKINPVQARTNAAAGMVQQSIGFKSSKMSTNTMVALHDVCKKAFDAQGLTFGTNEMNHSWRSIQEYLGKSPKLQRLWRDNSGNKWTKAMIDVLSTKGIYETPDTSRSAQMIRIRQIILDTSKLDHTTKLQIINAINQK